MTEVTTMSAHPSADEIFSALREPEGSPSVTAHLRGCDACRATEARLRTGAQMIDEARDTLPREPDWSRLDDVIAREADRAAADIRRGALRAPRRLPTPVVVGFAFAAAAAAVLVWQRVERPHDAEPVARHEAPTPSATVGPVETSPSVEGAVLLAAGDARVRASAGESPSSLAATRTLREGAELTTGDTGRAVVSVRQGWNVDVRAGTALTLTTLRAGETSLTLTRGEVRVQPDDPSTNHTSLRAGRWTALLEGAVAARVEASVVRVTVLSGRVSLDDGMHARPMTFTGPLVIELGEPGAEPRVVSSQTSDPMAIDMSWFSRAVDAAVLPTFDRSATLTLADHGALPSALELVRLAQPGVIEARNGRGVQRLEVRPGEPLQWSPLRPTVVASATPHPREAPAPSQAATTPATVGAHEPQLDARQLAMSSSVARRRLQHCFSTCQERNQCPESMSGAVVLSVGGDGAVQLSSLDPSAEGARRCVEEETHHMQLVSAGSNYDLRIPLSRGQ